MKSVEDKFKPAPDDSVEDVLKKLVAYETWRAETTKRICGYLADGLGIKNINEHTDLNAAFHLAMRARDQLLAQTKRGPKTRPANASVHAFVTELCKYTYLLIQEVNYGDPADGAHEMIHILCVMPRCGVGLRATWPEDGVLRLEATQNDMRDQPRPFVFEGTPSQAAHMVAAYINGTN